MEKDYGYYKIGIKFSERQLVHGKTYYENHYEMLPVKYVKKFIKALHRDKCSQFIHDSKKMYPVKCEPVVIDTFSVKLKSSSVLPKRIPLIVEVCDEGYKDAIFGIVFNTRKYNNFAKFPRFTSDASLVTPKYVADLIRGMSNSELAEYKSKVTEFASFIDSYGQNMKSGNTITQNENGITRKHKKN